MIGLEHMLTGEPPQPFHRPETSAISQIDGGIPVPLTPLIGREQELAHIGQILRARATRLLVLTGPGGVGKTRLAISVVHEVKRDFPDGVVLTNVSAARTRPDVLRSIADALGVRGSAESLFQEVLETLQGQETLLVLDNFEQVVDAAPVLTELLSATSSLIVLVTSRSILGVYGERVFPVPPFTVPEVTERSLQQIERSDAVRLFINRVQAIRPRFRLTERNARDIITICQRLDGIPLAIELAAARISLFSVSELADRLEQRLPMLDSGFRNVPDRYRTMRDAIGWSYDLLTPFERKVFRHLSIFTGPWNIEAADTLVFGPENDNGPQEIALLEAIGSLVDKSLVQRVETGDHDRNFRILQVLREFGIAELDAHGERAEVQDRHAAYMIDFARRAAPYLTGREQVAWLDQINLLEADITAVYERLMASDATDEALELITSVWRYGYARGNLLEFRTRIERALARTSAWSWTRAKALNAAGVLSNMLGDMEGTRRYHEQALEIAQAIDDKHLMAMAYFGLGDVATATGDDEAAEGHYLEAERLYTELNQTRGIATAQTNLGNLYWKQGKLQEALKLNEASRRLYQSAGDQRGLAWSYTNVGRLSAELRSFDRAATNLARAMELYDLIGDRTGIAETLEGYALINLGIGEHERAATLLGNAHQLRLQIDHPVPVNDMPAMERMIDALRQALGDSFDQLMAEGARLDLDEAITLATSTHIPGESLPTVAARNDSAHDILKTLGITDREMEVLQKLGAGESDKQIAETLYISVRTVQTHVQNLLSKFDAPSRAAAVAKAFRVGILH